VTDQISWSFPLLMVIATCVTGVIWLIDRLFFKPGRSGESGEPILVDYAGSFFPVLLIVLVLRSFVFEPFRIPSGSMIPTLLIGDYILVSNSPERGDVAVFRYPANPNQDYIKRVIGLPGDTIAYRDKTLFINGEEVVISGGDTYKTLGSDDINPGEVRRQEQLGDVLHDILVYESRGSVQRVWEVPEGHYFMVGDNRDNSLDSRSWGFVPEENLVGRAKYVWMHWSDGIHWSRFGTKIE